MQIAPFEQSVSIAALAALANGRPISADAYNAIIAALAFRSDIALGASDRKAIATLLPNGLVGYARIVGEKRPDLDMMLLADSDSRRFPTEIALYIFDVASALRASVARSDAAPLPPQQSYAAVYGPFADKMIGDRSIGIVASPDEAREALFILTTPPSSLPDSRQRYLPRSYGRSSVSKLLEFGVGIGSGFVVTLSLAYLIARRKIDAKRNSQKSVGISRVA